MAKRTVRESTPFPRRKPLRLPHFDYTQPGFACSLTLCVRGGRPVFLDPSLARRVSSILLEVRIHYGFSVYAYCLMPDHLHCVMSIQNGTKDVSAMVQEFKKLSTKAAWSHGCQGGLWQRSFYDHVIRRHEDLHGVCRYVLENPVRAGRVERAEDYPFSGMPDAIPV